MTPEQKKWIDESPYETLLAHWRFSTFGDPMFQGDTGEYYGKIMFEKRSALPDRGVSASKNIGWDK